jgi:hypothetical protein
LRAKAARSRDTKRRLEYASRVQEENSPATVRALVESLRYDPFYVAITDEFAGSEPRRLKALTEYFDYSMSEGARTGRLNLGNGLESPRNR